MILNVIRRLIRCQAIIYVMRQPKCVKHSPNTITSTLLHTYTYTTSYKLQNAINKD